MVKATGKVITTLKNQISKMHDPRRQSFSIRSNNTFDARRIIVAAISYLLHMRIPVRRLCEFSPETKVQ
jgi:hypothetical protein